VLALLVSAAPAMAAFPGANGDIAFTNDQECDGETLSTWTFDPDTGDLVDIFDGGGAPAWASDGNRIAYAAAYGIQLYVQTLGSSPQSIGSGDDPSWSPGGTKLAIIYLGDLATVNADGTGFQVLVPSGGDFTPNSSPKWSPDGTRIAFVGRLNGETDDEIYVLTLASGDVTKLTDNTVNDFHPDWSPNGGELAFERQGTIYRMNASGGGQTPALATGGGPAWSPDGTRIAFSRSPYIYSMAADG
jgi:TolB protein